jgi:prepilin-type N-terminal cleavage/methylation domain-containing protein
MRNKGFTLIELMIVIAIIAIIAAIAIPNLIEARKHGNEAAAIGALKTICTSQTLFREGDKDKDNDLDYGSITELSTSGLIDEVLGSGTKQGYIFECEPHSTQPTFLWAAVANPAVPGTTGDRSFCTNQGGVVYYTVNDDNTSPSPIVIGDADAISEVIEGEGYTPVGK